VNNRGDTGEEPIEVRRYLEALRRSLPLIAGITLVLTLSAYLVSSSLAKRYEAQASIVRQNLTVLDQTLSADSATRDLNTASILLTTRRVLQAAAREVPGETADSLAGKVKARVDPGADFIYVTASDSEPARAAAIANAVAQTFVAQRTSLERSEAQRERADLQRELARLRRSGGSTAQIQTVEASISDLGVSIAGAGTGLTVAEPADAPTKPVSPHPLRDAGLGVVLGVFLSVLVALGREQLMPRVSSPRELSRLIELPILVTVPAVGGRSRRALSGLEHEAYQALATSIRLSLPPAETTQTVLVTSAVRAEGKSTVAVRLGRALAHAGHRTLIVSADLRHPTVHEALGVPLEPGLSDLLVSLPRKTPAQGHRLATKAIRPVGGDRRALLHVLPSGRKPDDPADALAADALDKVFAVIGELEFTYVLVDSPSLLGVADSQALARRCSSILYVAKLDRVTLENVVDVRDVLDRLDRRPIGMVVIGGRSEASSYYIGDRAPAYEDV
jgi:Mrp family chromosome partitioning ATPase/capsular polysaccharide biosynthesis protein